MVCIVECQRSDWKRHKREECLVVKIEDGMPAEECSCHRCKAGLTDIGDDDVSDFFNGLSMMRGRKEVSKFIDENWVRRYHMHKNDVHILCHSYLIYFVSFDSSKTITKTPLTKEELDETIAYPYQRFILLGSFGLFDVPEPKTLYTSNDKGFTVGQLADAMAKAEEGNTDRHHRYFEGFMRGKDPHSFIATWGS